MCFCGVFKAVAMLLSSDSQGVPGIDEGQGYKNECIIELLRRYIHMQHKTRQPELIK